MNAGGWSRRSFAACCLAGTACAGLPAGSSAALALPADRRFAIHRDGTEIGRHEVSFRMVDGALEVETEIDLKVKIAFNTAFHFEQQAHDRWVDGQLVESRSSTDDNGKTTRTVIRSTAKPSASRAGSRTVSCGPLGTMTDNAFRNLDIVRHRTWSTSRGGAHQRRGGHCWRE
jgi:hypothetical protein